jgi:hypothetical protein
MADIFISYAEQDRSVAEQIGCTLPGFGYSTWFYHRDYVPGVQHLETTKQQIEAASVAIILVSRASLGSDFVFPELLHVVALRKHMMPVLIDIRYDELEREKPRWVTALGFSVAVSWDGGKKAMLDIVHGVAALLANPEISTPDYVGGSGRKASGPGDTGIKSDGGEAGDLSHRARLDEEKSARIREQLEQFKARFAKTSNTRKMRSLLSEGEDLLTHVCGEERYNSFIQDANEAVDGEEECRQRRNETGMSFLSTRAWDEWDRKARNAGRDLKKRIAGIEYRK